jgi:hypothetical protein
MTDQCDLRRRVVSHGVLLSGAHERNLAEGNFEGSLIVAVFTALAAWKPKASIARMVP